MIEGGPWHLIKTFPEAQNIKRDHLAHDRRLEIAGSNEQRSSSVVIPKPIFHAIRSGMEIMQQSLKVCISLEAFPVDGETYRASGRTIDSGQCIKDDDDRVIYLDQAYAE